MTWCFDPKSTATLEEVIVVGDGVEEVDEPEPLPQPGISNARNKKPLPDNRTMFFNFAYLGTVGAGKPRAHRVSGNQLESMNRCVSTSWVGWR
jgi:hypothetical protein